MAATPYMPLFISQIQIVETQMPDAIADSVQENYKGILQEYCHARNLENPEYETLQHDTAPNEPSWNVTIKYGKSTYTSPQPIHGTKRFAEQAATKQLLDFLESDQNRFLIGPQSDQTETAPEPSTSALPTLQAEIPSTETLYVRVEIVTSVLGIANHRLSERSRQAKLSESTTPQSDNETFVRELASLTIRIVREVIKAAEVANFKFGNEGNT